MFARKITFATGAFGGGGGGSGSGSKPSVITMLTHVTKLVLKTLVEEVRPQGLTHTPHTAQLCALSALFNAT